MGKIFVRGNSHNTSLPATIDAEVIEMPIFTLNEAGERQLIDFVINKTPKDLDGVVIDVDSIANEELCLAYIMALRLSLEHLGQASLANIILATDKPFECFRSYPYSPVVLTSGVIFESPDRIADAIENLNPISVSDYKKRFLNVIKILPNALEGHHSLANQWGADVLNRILFGTSTQNDVRRSMYFMYTRLQTLSEQELSDIVSKQDRTAKPALNNTLNITGKRILLIDDEADKGWSDILKKILAGNFFDVIQVSVPDYISISDEARNKIETGNFDLILLDLRLNGTKEEDYYNPEDFSGIKILKEIKKQNKGTQVIIFTASNKAWNMKAVLDAGADGYYIKESPEYIFSRQYSEKNSNALIKSIQECLEKSYLKGIYKKIASIKSHIEGNNSFAEKTEEILASIDVAFDLLAKSYNKNEYRSYSFLQLFLVIEEYVRQQNIFDETDDGLYLYNGESRYRLLKDKTFSNSQQSYKSVLSFGEGGHYQLRRGTHTRAIDTNFRVSALLIFAFGEENSASHGWTKIYRARNDKVAHPKSSIVSIDDFENILNFMEFIFDESNQKWRDLGDAFEDISLEEGKMLLARKFNRH